MIDLKSSALHLPIPFRLVQIEADAPGLHAAWSAARIHRQWNATCSQKAYVHFLRRPAGAGLLVEDMTTGTKTIMLVDDEVRERKRLRVILRSAGYDVIEARDFHEARATYQRRRDEIQMLLIDVSLPGNNGCELAKSARAHDPEVKVLLMSGRTGAEVCKFYGIPATDVHFLAKPFRAADLVERVRYVLESGEPLSGSARGGTG